MRQCEWCGHRHPRERLCSKRPTWSRRGFLEIFGVGIVGLAVSGLTFQKPQWINIASGSSAAELWEWSGETNLYLAC